MKAFLKNHNVIVCVGTGGVGKTTVSAGLAVAAAKEGLKVLVLTIDPSKRLKTALGLEGEITEYVKVPLKDASGELWAFIVDPARAFASYIERASGSKEKAQRILNNKLFQQLATSLSGSQEFTSIDALYQAASSKQFDLVILDTPPAQHAIEFLQAPQKIYSLFQRGITKWFTEPSADQGWLQKVISKGTQTVFSALEKVTGSEFIHELTDFFKSVQHIEEKISLRGMEAHRLLTAPTTSFLLVSSMDENKLAEASDFQRDLNRGGHHLGAIIINRTFPLPKEEDSKKAPPQPLQPVWQKYLAWAGYYRSLESKIEETTEALFPSTPILKLPDFDEDIYGLESLGRIAQAIKNKWI